MMESFVIVPLDCYIYDINYFEWNLVRKLRKISKRDCLTLHHNYVM